MLFNDASRASAAMMMAAADHDKDGYLSESDVVSSFIHVESGVGLLQADCNESKLAKLGSSSESDDAVLGSLASLSTQEKSQKDAHLLKALSKIRMRGVEVTNLCSQSNRAKCVAISPDGNLYAVVHRHDNVAHVYMISNGTEVRRLVGHQGSLLGILFSPDRKHVVTAARQLHGLLGSHDRTGVPLLRAPGNRHGSCGELRRQVCLRRLSG
ncbi:WD domain G-beta repeat [Leishmania donovani]|uniref:WD_domain_-_G-beta_repeat_-_putative n=2 Tax=Leishmania donovani species complex TaxID=38574 RepID=A0A6L0XGK4_LEIIN|nr:WD_domain_-_G-beta_repeat_-_putative [Leishmania infantum]CAJ1989747.1 WD domain G-beta repeat [Leishmania donovani]SUZ42749.1 WD_domain_-_G-beta_repeat_-_putative [Leishmania infantum]VDZ45611.1 WD_domain_G-beta_repeat_putative/Pfam:PF00400 [Leishmania donovani]